MWFSTVPLSARRLILGLGGVALCLALFGFRAGGLPFIPQAQFSDAAISHWGAALHLQRSVWSGEYPLWQNVLLAGAPFAANPLNKVTYPPQVLALILPPSVHLNVMILLHLLIGTLGMWRWARAWQLGDIGATLAVLSYMMAPRMLGHLGAGHLDIYYAMAWLPCLMTLLHNGARKGAGLRYLLSLSMVGAMLVLADVRVSLFAGMFAVAYLLWRAAALRDFWRVGWALGALVSFAVLVAGLIVPLMGWQPYLTRSDLSPLEAGIFSVEPLALVGMLLPSHSGQIETLVYFGLGVFVLAGLGLVGLPRGARIFFGGVLLVALLWTLGEYSPLWRWAAQWEFIRWFRVPSRAWLIITLVMPLLAGMGAQALMHAAERWRTGTPPKSIFWLRLGAAGVTGMFGVCGVSLLVANVSELPASVGVMLIFNALALAAVLFVVLMRRGRALWVGVSVLAIVAVDLGVTGWHWLEWRAPSVWYHAYTPVSTWLRQDAAARVYSPNYALPQQVAIGEGIALFYGIDPFQLQAHAQAILSASGVPDEGYSVVMPPLVYPQGVEASDDALALANSEYRPDSSILAAWGVSHVVSLHPLEVPALMLAQRVGEVYIYRNSAYIPSAAPPMQRPPAETAQLHQRTLAAQGFSAVGWLVMVMLWLWATVQERKSRNAP